MLLEAVAAEFRERPPRAMNERDAEDMKYARESLYKLAEMLWRDGVELRESERFSIFNR